MAQKTDIRLRRSDTAGKIPTSTNLSDGELAINTNSGALYFKKSDDTIITVHDNTILHIDSDTTGSSETGSSPKVGIGTTSPGYKLDVNGQIHGTAAYIDGYIYHTGDSDTYINYSTDNIILSAGGPVMHVKGSGRVGIGTSSPSYPLEITGNVSINTNSGNKGLRIITAADSEAYVIFGDGSDNSMGSIVYNNASNYLSISANNAERMRITSAGNFGIGTTSPATKFHISESSNATSPQLRITNDSSDSLTMGVVRSAAGTAPDTSFISFDNSLRFIGGTGTTDERVRITEAGNVGIKNTNPTATLTVGTLTSGQTGNVVINNEGGNTATLEVLSRTNRSVLKIADNDTIGYMSAEGGILSIGRSSGLSANNINIDSSHRVGIGTSSPSEKLHVTSGSTNSNTFIKIESGTTAGNYSALQVGRTDSSNAVQVANAVSGGVPISGIAGILLGSNSTALPAVAIRTPNSSAGHIVFNPKDTERMRITSDGNVGIRTNAPESSLHVQHGSDTSAAVIITGGHTGRRLKIQSYQTGGASGAGFLFNADSSSGALKFQTTSTDRMIIANDGNVGIGLTAPGTKLHVLNGADNNIAAGVSDVRFIGADKPLTGEQANLVIQTNDDMAANKGGSIGFGGRHTTSSTNGANFAHISGRKENSTSANFAGYLSFGTSDSISDIHERMRIDSSGNIGIGTSSPSDLLHVEGNFRVQNGYINLRSSYPRIYLTDTGDNPDYQILNDNGVFSILDGTNSVHRLRVASTGITFNNAFTFPTSIGSAGQVLKVPNSGSTLVWANESGGGGATDGIEDADGDTKIQVEESSDEDIIRFDTAGSQRMVILANGNVGIGNNAGTPSAKLTVSGSTLLELPSSSNTFRIQDSQNNVERFRVTQDGKVGIGTSSPAAALHIGNAGHILLERGGELRSKDTGGNVRTIGRVNSSNELEYGWSANAPVKFMGGGSYTERMRIHTNGNVGIGTTAPGSKLHVVGNGFFSGGVTVGDSAADTFVAKGHTHLATLGNNVGIGTTSPGAKLHIVHNDTTDALLLEATEDSSSAAPVLTFKRNSGSVADADYLGQLKFKGENDADQEVVYAKITAKIQDASDGTEDGLIEFANKKAGSNVITARLRSDSLQLLNGTGLTVAGDATITGNLTVDGTTTTLNTATLDVEDKNITLNYGSGDTSATADGAGITIQDAVNSSTNATILWDGTNDEFDFSHAINTAGAITAQRIIGTQTNGSSLYALELTRSGGGTTTPDIYGTNGTFVIGTSSSTEAVGFSSADSFFYGELNIPSKIRHSGDSDNYFSFAAADTQSFVTGNSTRLQITNSLVRFNQEGLNQDFQVFGQNIDNLLYVDASTDRVGIGTATPGRQLHVQMPNLAAGTGNGIRITDDSALMEIGLRKDGSGNRRLAIFEDGGTYPLALQEDGGKVGIGTTSPQYQLDIQGSTASARVHKTANDATVIISSSTAGAWTTYKSPNFYTGALYNINGVEQWAAGLLQGVDRWTIRKGRSGSEYFTITNPGKVGISQSAPAARFQVEEYGIDTTETSTSATTQVAIHTFAATDFRSARFTIQVTNSTDSTYHTSEILLVHDGTDAYITEFGEIHTGTAEEATFDADISSGSVRLLATPASTDAMVFKIVCHSVTV